MSKPKDDHNFEANRLELMRRIIAAYAECIASEHEVINSVIDGLFTLAFLEPDHDCQTCAKKILTAMQIIAQWEREDGFHPEQDDELKRASIELANYKLNGKNVN